MPRDKQARKGVTILVGIIDLDHEGGGRTLIIGAEKKNMPGELFWYSAA